ncbi:MAG: family 10 glycosylhydrolase [Armatimonadota bacterium]|nr:family 10 glycosylhydrolase [Armatimonadota bacterium]
MKTYFLVVLVPILSFVACAWSAGDKLSGHVGAYMSLRDGSPESIAALVNEAADAGIEFLLPIAKSTSGKAYYKSEIIPEARPELPDMLKTVIDVAHKRGLKVYPWICVNCDGGEQPSKTLEEHPDWCVISSNGKSGGYIDPSSQEARDFVCSIIREIVAKYDVDGINLDYVRYPSGRNCFCERCVKLFKEATGYDARDADKAEVGSDKWRKWRAWRMKQINLEMEQIRKAVDEIKPGLPISSYVWGVHTYGERYQTCQDWKTWIRKGWLNWINPSGYVYNMKDFTRRVAENKAAIPEGFPYFVTIGVRTSHGRLNSADEIKAQVKEAMRLGADGVVFFTLEATRSFFGKLSPFLKQVGKANAAFGD